MKQKFFNNLKKYGIALWEFIDLAIPFAILSIVFSLGLYVLVFDIVNHFIEIEPIVIFASTFFISAPIVHLALRKF